MQMSETLTIIKFSNQCNEIRRYNIWYNKSIFTMLFSTLIYPHVFKQINNNRQYRAFGNVGLNTYANSTLAIGGVSSPLDSFVVAESSVLRINFCAEKPAHRQSAKRYGQV
jgi:hypothetical protein